MDSTGTELHPNWRALSTLYFPLKRFVTPGEIKIQNDDKQQKYKIENINGKEIREFYDELIENSIETSSTIKKIENETKKYEPPKKPFATKTYFQAAMTNNVKVLENMCFEDIDVNILDDYGWTALMMAACEGAIDAVRFLIKLGVNKHIKDKSGLSAIDLAKKKGFKHVENILTTTIEKQIEPNEEEKIIYEPFFCTTCQQLIKETTEKKHLTSTIHNLYTKSDLPPNPLRKFNIRPNHRGLKIMVKQGWDRESGLGPTQNGSLYPIKTVIRKRYTGLGIKQDVARVTHFQPFDLNATRRQNPYKKTRNRNDMRREKLVEWKRQRRLRQELS